MMKLITWNVNSLRAIAKKDINNKSFEEYLSAYDIICLSETKLTTATTESLSILADSHPYQVFSCSTKKKGYSGVAIISKVQPKRELKSFECNEGRVLSLEFENFILVNVYSPNAGEGLKRLDYKIGFTTSLLRMLRKFQKVKPVILVGDLNVAHQEIDVFKPDTHHMTAGFTDEERSDFDKLLSKTGMIDSWRHFHPKKIQYTFFSYRIKARNGNRGWRLDYVIVDKRLIKKIKSVTIEDVHGSDHLPVRCVFK